VLLVKKNNVEGITSEQVAIVALRTGGMVPLPSSPPWANNSNIYLGVGEKALQGIKKNPIHAHKVVIGIAKHKNLNLSSRVSLWV